MGEERAQRLEAWQSFFFFFHCCDKLPSKRDLKESGLALLEKAGQPEYEGSGHVASAGRKRRERNADA